jgi:hypothetical protein
MYSLGVLIYEILTGVPPFRGGTPDDLLRKHLAVTAPNPSWTNKNVTKEADQFVLRLLAKKPSERPANMDEILSQFRSLKIFEEAVEAISERKKVEKEEQKKLELDKPETRLDSRADAQRTLMGVKAPPKAIKARPKVEEPVEPAPPMAPAPPPAMPPMPAPTYAPMPGYGYPQMPPQMPYPGAMPPGAMPPGAYPPGPYGPAPYGYPPQPGYPPAAHLPPQQPMMPPPAAPPVSAVPPAPAIAPPAPSPPAKAPPPPPPAPLADDDLPVMDELPPIA